MESCNSDSQKHRPGATVNASPLVRLEKQLHRATELEKELSTLKKSCEQKAARLRSQLCEILSDMLISDPQFAWTHDCAGWLWKSCFYSPIGTLRSRISREKRKQGPGVAKIEQSFKNFLGEAITLYDYLVAQFQSKLIPYSVGDATTTRNSQQSSQESSMNNQSAEGVVPGLYRLYIHLGDLYRYNQTYSKAETCYLNSSKLAPGMGNPYNQLAVVAQLKDSNMSCVALYWYARSLLASHDPFETSSSNLERMFVLNREHLKEHSRDDKAPILSPNNATTSNTKNNTNTNKKASLELARAQKAAASRSCLVHFVDLHFDLFSGFQNKELVREKIQTITASVESLLQVSAFGDALLCKMVTINVFSVVNNTERKKKEISSEISDSQAASTSFLYSFASCLATRLVAALQKLLEKTVKGLPSIRLLLPILLVCEYIETFEAENKEHDNNNNNNNNTEKDKSYFHVDRNKFWTQIADAANLIVRLIKTFQVKGGNNDTSIDEEVVQLKEYQLFKGFKPYPFLNGDYPNQDAFIVADEAVDVLELTMSQSQESSNSCTTVDNGIKLTRFQDFCIRQTKSSTGLITRNGDDGPFELRSTPIVDNKMSLKTEMAGVQSLLAAASSEEFTESGGDANDAPVFEEDEAGDVVLYKAPEIGDGPPLLVPGALLTMDQAANYNNSNNDASDITSSEPPIVKPALDTPIVKPALDTPILNPAMTLSLALDGIVGDDVNNATNKSSIFSMTDEKQSAPVKLGGGTVKPMELDETPLNVPPPPGIMPPPGFGGPVATTVPAEGVYHGHSGVYPPASFAPPGATGMQFPLPLPHMQPYAGQMCAGPPFTGFPPGSTPSNHQGMTLGHSLQWFGGPSALQTANPFANHPSNTEFTNNQNALFEPEATSVEGTSLLDSSLLSSLWMEDGGNQTKNPFASNY